MRLPDLPVSFGPNNGTDRVMNLNDCRCYGHVKNNDSQRGVFPHSCIGPVRALQTVRAFSAESVGPAEKEITAQMSMPGSFYHVRIPKSKMGYGISFGMATGEPVVAGFGSREDPTPPAASLVKLGSICVGVEGIRTPDLRSIRDALPSGDEADFSFFLPSHVEKANQAIELPATAANGESLLL
eukprot:SAG31_NODE_2595_length_5421_cov_2.387636_4_plen_184_part_00